MPLMQSRKRSKIYTFFSDIGKVKSFSSHIWENHMLPGKECAYGHDSTMETSSHFIASFVVFCTVIDYFVDCEWNEIFNTFKNPKLFLIFLFLVQQLTFVGMCVFMCAYYSVIVFPVVCRKGHTSDQIHEVEKENKNPS